MSDRHTGNVVDGVVDDDEHVVALLVLGDLGLGELLGHDGGGWVWCGVDGEEEQRKLILQFCTEGCRRQESAQDSVGNGIYPRRQAGWSEGRLGARG